MMAGCYSLELYCDNEDSPLHEYNEFPHQFIHEFGSVCRSRARKKGWLLGRGFELCPKCSGKVKNENQIQGT